MIEASFAAEVVQYAAILEALSKAELELFLARAQIVDLEARIARLT